MSTVSTTSNQPSSITTIQPTPTSAWKSFLAGTVGGVFGLTLVYPLDTVKVRIQTRPMHTYNGILHCLNTTIQQEGYKSLYRGIASPVIGYGAIKATAFGSNKYAQNMLMSYYHTQQLNGTQLVLCGGIAGAVQTFIRAPVEQIKVVMQSSSRQIITGTVASSTVNTPIYKNTLQCLLHVVRSEGIINGLYRSFWPTLWREIPQYALYFPLFEYSKSFIQVSTGQNDLSPLYTALAGGIAGVGQWLPTYPLDVIKSKISAAPPHTYKNTIDCAMRSIQSDGSLVLWRGVSASLLRAFPLHGAVFVGYEMTVKFLK